jgi:transposase
MSRRAAAERFGVGVSTAIKWVRRWQETGCWAAKRSGGDVRSHRIDAFHDEILVLVEATPDITLAEVADHLHRTHGVQLALSTVFRFFRRHEITYKKRRRTLSNRIVPT